MSNIQQETLQGLEYSIQRETRKRMRSLGGVPKSGEYEIKLSDLACGLQPDEAAQLYEWVSSKSTWKKIKLILNIDDVGQSRGVNRRVQIRVGDVNRAELASKAKREFLDAQSLGVNDDAMDTLEAGGDSLAPELTGDLYEDLQNMKTVADVNKLRAYYNQMCDARVSELKSKKRNRQSGEAEEDDIEELEGRSAYEDAALKGVMCYIVIVIDNSIILYNFILFYSSSHSIYVYIYCTSSYSSILYVH